MIELLIVVAIIGILAAIAVPNFLNAQIRAKVSRSYADMKNLTTAIESLRLDKGVMLVDWWDDDAEWGHERLREVFNMVGAGPDFEARSPACLLAPLTSPVSYMSSIPKDPFAPKESSPETSYRYADNDPAGEGYDHGLGALFPENAPALGLRELNVNDFILVGAGPDGQMGLGAGYGDPVRALPYDISNGLNSAGDITLRNGGGINQ